MQITVTVETLRERERATLLLNRSAVDFSKQKRNNRVIKKEDSFKKCA